VAVIEILVLLGAGALIARQITSPPEQHDVRVQQTAKPKAKMKVTLVDRKTRLLAYAKYVPPGAPCLYCRRDILSCIRNTKLCRLSEARRRWIEAGRP
jgi:hypothetical protein